MFQTRVRSLFVWPEFLLVVVACVVVLGLPPSSAVADDQVNPIDLKAAFTLNFLRFVDWPPERVPSGSEPYVVAVFNDGSLERAVGTLAAGQNIDGRKIAVRRVSSVDEAADAHVVFIGAREERRLGSLVQQLSGAAVLTVGDTPGYGQAGVMLNLFVANQRVQFEANTAAASRAGVKLRSSLLRLARIVG